MQKTNQCRRWAGLQLDGGWAVYISFALPPHLQNDQHGLTNLSGVHLAILALAFLHTVFAEDVRVDILYIHNNVIIFRLNGSIA